MPNFRPARLAAYGVAMLTIVAAAVAAPEPAGAATAMANALYGDPSHPNLSGMWNPEFAYFGPPPGGAPPGGPPRAAPPGGGAPGGPPPGAGPRGPAGPQLTPAYAAKFAAWQKKFEV